MPDNPYTCPLPREKVIDQYFLEHRAKLIDVAAFLDRVDRAVPVSDDCDYRLAAMRKAIEILIDGKGDRARRILECLSDPTIKPIEKATEKSAAGAWAGGQE